MAKLIMGDEEPDLHDMRFIDPDTYTNLQKMRDHEVVDVRESPGGVTMVTRHPHGLQTGAFEEPAQVMIQNSSQPEYNTNGEKLMILTAGCTETEFRLQIPFKGPATAVLRCYAAEDIADLYRAFEVPSRKSLVLTNITKRLAKGAHDQNSAAYQDAAAEAELLLYDALGADEEQLQDEGEEQTVGNSTMEGDLARMASERQSMQGKKASAYAERIRRTTSYIRLDHAEIHATYAVEEREAALALKEAKLEIRDAKSELQREVAKGSTGEGLKPHQTRLDVAKVSQKEAQECWSQANATLEGISTGQLIDIDADMVTYENLDEYVELKSRKILVDNVKEYAEEIKKGYQYVMTQHGRRGGASRPTTWQQLLTAVEGNATLDVAVWRRSTAYGGLKDSDELVNWLWEYIEESPLEKRKKILTFWSGWRTFPASMDGTSRVMKLDLDRKSASHLPETHTCFHQMLIPAYTSKAKVVEKMDIAINCTDFLMG